MAKSSKTKVGAIELSIFEKQQIIEAIKTVIIARWFFITVAVIQVVLFQIIYAGSGNTMSVSRLALLSGISYGYNFIYWLYLRRAPEKISDVSLRTIGVLQVVGDMIIISMILYIDTTVNIFVAAFFLDVVLIASVIYKKVGILLTTLATCLLFTLLAYIEYLGYFPPLKAPYYLIGLKGNFIMLERTLIVFYAGLGGAGFLSGCIAALFRRRESGLILQRDELLEKTQTLIEQKKEFTETKNWLKDSFAKSDRLRIEADKSRQSEEIEKNKVEAVIENLTTGLIFIDKFSKILLMNNQAEKLFAIKKSMIINQKINSLEMEDFKNLAKLIDNAEGEQIHKKEITLTVPDKNILEISTADVLDFNDKILGKIIVLNDITREKAVEKMKSEFITITAHQLRTPLSAVKWSFGLMLEEETGKINKDQKRILEEGYKSNERMIDLINDLLNVMRLEEGKFSYKYSQISLAGVTENAVQSFKHLGKIKDIKLKIIKTPKDENFEVIADKEKISLVVQNLIENALNYSPAKTIITIELKNSKDKQDYIFSIADQGIGITETEISRMFTKFFRGENAVKMVTDGNGLGLYLSKNIIEGHKGKLWFESVGGKGSVFHFSLPASRAIFTPAESA